MIHNNKVYANADEKFVKKTILYTKRDDPNKKLFHDVECTNPVMRDEIVDLYLNDACVYWYNSGTGHNNYVAIVTCDTKNGNVCGLDSYGNGMYFETTAPTE